MNAAGSVAAALFVYVILAAAALPFLRPEYDGSINWISDYAVGRLGWLQSSAFVATGAGVFTLLIGLVRLGPATWTVRTGLVFLAALAPGMCVAALFQTDLPGHP